MNKIDIHLHLTGKTGQGTNPPGIGTGEAMIPHLHELGFYHGILMSGGEDKAPVCNNKDCAALSERYPDTFSWMCNLDYEEPETIGERLEKYKMQGAVGVGELMINQSLADPFLQELFSCAEKLELPVLIHMSPEVGYQYGVVDEAGLPLLEALLQRFPKLILIGHSQPFWHEITGDPPSGKEERNTWGAGPVKPGGRLEYLFASYPNLMGDLSANSGGCAIMRDEPYGLNFLERFQDQLLFGSDMVNETMLFPLGQWLDQQYRQGSLSVSAYEKIYYKNAQKLFGLKTAAECDRKGAKNEQGNDRL